MHYRSSQISTVHSLLLRCILCIFLVYGLLAYHWHVSPHVTICVMTGLGIFDFDIDTVLLYSDKCQRFWCTVVEHGEKAR